MLIKVGTSTETYLQIITKRYRYLQDRRAFRQKRFLSKSVKRDAQIKQPKAIFKSKETKSQDQISRTKGALQQVFQT
jgi:hypothetical protein